MTSIDTSALSAQAVWTRFIAQADTNGDGDLDKDELAAIDPKSNFEDIMKARDADGDGVLSTEELPKGAFSPMLFEQLLNAQEYRDATPEARAEDNAKAVAQLFARADIDGDGALSRDEWDAERAFNMSCYADGGEAGDVSFLVSRQAWDRQSAAGEDGEQVAGLRPEDIMVGRRMALTPVAGDELPDGWAERIEKLIEASHNEQMGQQPQMAERDPEAMRAELKARVDEIPMSSAFMTRLLMSLSESVAAEATA